MMIAENVKERIVRLGRRPGESEGGRRVMERSTDERGREEVAATVAVRPAKGRGGGRQYKTKDANEAQRRVLAGSATRDKKHVILLPL